MAQHEQGVSRQDVDGQPAWVKRYGYGRRRIRLALLAAVVRMLRVMPLKPPPRHPGDAARAVEERRIRALHAADVTVPAILRSGPNCLVLSDLGGTLAGRLREADGEDAERLFSAAAEAIACVHASGHYLGQPLPRNITVDALGRIGFLDFEEDPGEVMSLTQAQARDWLVFASGAARHVPFTEERMAQLIAEAMASVPAAVRGELGTSVARLGFLRGLSRLVGGRGASIGKALGSLQRALWAAGWVALSFGLGLDLVHDGELELIGIMTDLFD